MRNLHLAQGSDAQALLAQSSFIAGWESLERKCAWTTPFQRARFATTWYDVYAPTASPILVYREDSEGGIDGLLALAAVDDGTRLSVVGAEQSEYQGWLAAPDNPDFIGQALAEIVRSTRFDRLVLQYLPPGAPLADLDGARSYAGSLKRGVSRGLMRLDPEETTRTLRKSGNRSKLNRLKQLGPVRLDRLRTRAELEPLIDEIAAQYDIRQCVLSGVMPFRDDSRKRDFHLRLLEHGDLLHATVLRAGDTLAAAHLGLAGRRDVAVGVIAHSPFLAAHSPGKLLLLLLGDHLAGEGFAYLDLTPTGGYKDRFATDTDVVEIRDIYLRPRAFTKARVVALGRSRAKQLVVATRRFGNLSDGQAIERAQRVARHVSPSAMRSLPRRLARGLAKRVYQRLESCFYRLSADEAKALENVHDFACDALEDLRRYPPAGRHERSRQQFCGVALERLEAGQHVYTRVENGVLVHTAWLIPHPEGSASEFGQPYALEPRSAILYDDFTHPQARGRGLQRRSLIQRAREAVTRWGSDWIYVSVLSDNAPSRRNIERLGFRRCATFVRTVRFGRVHLARAGDD